MPMSDKRRTREIRRRLQLWSFDQLYRHAWFYDPLSRLVFGDEWHRWRQAVLPFVGPGRVLDLGCGTGALLPELHERAIAVGVDRSPSMLRVASRRARRGWLVRAAAGALPFRDAAFTTVVSTFPAPFILERDTLAEVARVLEPGGRFVVVLGGEITDWQGWRRPVGALARLFYGDRVRGGTPSTDVLAHPALPGVWHTVATPRGHAHLWVASRTDRPAAGG